MRSKSYYQVIPVGRMKIVYLYERENFVDLVSTLAYKGNINTIPRSMGAVSFFGIKNWKKIDSLIEQFVEKNQMHPVLLPYSAQLLHFPLSWR